MEHCTQRNKLKVWDLLNKKYEPDRHCVVINMEYIITGVKAQIFILEGETHKGV